jgi:hypothetical protein
MPAGFVKELIFDGTRLGLAMEEVDRYGRRVAEAALEKFGENESLEKVAAGAAKVDQDMADATGKSFFLNTAAGAAAGLMCSTPTGAAAFIAGTGILAVTTFVSNSSAARKKEDRANRVLMILSHHFVMFEKEPAAKNSPHVKKGSRLSMKDVEFIFMSLVGMLDRAHLHEILQEQGVEWEPGHLSHATNLGFHESSRLNEIFTTEDPAIYTSPPPTDKEKKSMNSAEASNEEDRILDRLEAGEGGRFTTKGQLKKVRQLYNLGKLQSIAKEAAEKINNEPPKPAPKSVPKSAPKASDAKATHKKAIQKSDKAKPAPEAPEAKATQKKAIQKKPAKQPKVKAKAKAVTQPKATSIAKKKTATTS